MKTSSEKALYRDGVRVGIPDAAACRLPTLCGTLWGRLKKGVEAEEGCCCWTGVCWVMPGRAKLKVFVRAGEGGGISLMVGVPFIVISLDGGTSSPSASSSNRGSYGEGLSVISMSPSTCTVPVSGISVGSSLAALPAVAS